MQKRELSKLQIRAEVLSLLQQYGKETDFKPSKQQQNLELLESINDRVFVVEILLKEFLKSSDYKRKIISLFLNSLVTLEDVEELLWDFLKNPKISDRIKEDIINILRNLGARINTDELLNYLENPDELIDKETKNLLETAKVNPEAQVDFLDFLFALKTEEQIQLINSLKEDYPGDDLANILAPALKVCADTSVQKILLEVIGTSKSYLAIEPLMYLSENSEDESIKRLARKNLSLLKLSGLNLEDTAKMHLRETEICKIYNVYEAYASLPDGVGSQGIILSRIKNNKIYMFSTVVNDKDGIIDCFGFSNITKEEFHKIIDRFTQNTKVVKVPPEYCKSILENAETLNLMNKSTLVYEYICWKIYISDINKMQKSIEESFSFNQVELTDENYEKLYKSGDFDTWFFEYNDEPEIDKIIDFVSGEFNDKTKNFIQKIDEQIEITIKNISDENRQNTLYSRLMNCAYLYGLNNNQTLKDISASIAQYIKNSAISDFSKIKFIKDIIKRSILQYIGGFLEQEEEDSKIKKSPFSMKNVERKKSALDYNEAIAMLNYLEEYWS